MSFISSATSTIANMMRFFQSLIVPRYGWHLIVSTNELKMETRVFLNDKVMEDWQKEMTNSGYKVLLKNKIRILV